MAATNASKSNIVNNLRITAAKEQVRDLRAASAYVRPADWLTLPTVTTSDTKLVGLMAVTDDSTNFVSISLVGTSLSATIDWGDGTSNSGLATGSITSHVYNYSTLSSTVSSRGYKMAIVTITVQSGTWTGFNLCAATPVSIAGPSTVTTYKWLDIAFAGNDLGGVSNSMTLSGVVTGPQSTMLEQVNIVKINQLSGTGASMFQNTATALQNVIIGIANTPQSNASVMFSGCASMQISPANLGNFITGGNVANMFANCTSLAVVNDIGVQPSISSNMFAGCTSLQTFPPIDFTKSTNTSNMFFACNSLNSIPKIINMPNVANMSYMFNQCLGLTEAPDIYAPLATDTSGLFLNCGNLSTAPGYNFPNTANSSFMFSSCQELTEVGVMNMPNSTIAFSMFNNCNSLKTVPSITLKNTLANTANMFALCGSLTSAPVFDTSNVTSVANMFNGCQSFDSIPLYNTGNVANFDNMLSACRGLTEVPLFDTSKATSMVSMLSGCVNLVTVPTYNTSNATNISSMFNSCINLQTIPSLDTTKVTNMASTFTSCTNINSVPALNTSNVLSFATTFSSCSSLNIAPNFDTSKATTVTGMFNGCSSLSAYPAYNVANIGTTLTGFTSNPAASNIAVTGLKSPHSIAANKLGKIELENYFANLIGIPAVSTALTITSNPGADTANAKTSGTTAGSNVVTMANTVGIIAGSTFLYGTGMNTGIPVTFTDAGDTVQYTNGGGVNGLANGDNVLFTAITTTTGIAINTRYWVVNRTGTTFQVSSTQGGAALPLTTNGTGTMSIGGATISNKVVTVTTNVAVIISGVAGITNAAAALTARNLNTNYATTKNWAITG